MNEPFTYKKIEGINKVKERVMFFDPSEVYSRMIIDPFKRIQSTLEFKIMFPPIVGNTCDCGCGKELSGKQRRWASEDCSHFAVDVWAIIDGRVQTINWYLYKYYGYKCSKCGGEHDLKIDHIIPVKHGGGGCWLSNYQYLCHKCHVEKTNEDFGWKQERKLLQSQLALQL